MTLRIFRNAIITAYLLCFSTVQAATFGELADAQARAGETEQAQSSQYRPGMPPPMGQEPGYREPVVEYVLPWVLDQNGLTPRVRVLRWGHGQQQGFDDPHSWEYLDNPFFWARWGNPLAPYSSAAINHWWHSRGRELRPYSYPPGRW